MCIPPSLLQSQLTPQVLDRKHLMHLPPLEVVMAHEESGKLLARRAWLKAATAALTLGLPGIATASSQLIFSPEDEVARAQTASPTNESVVVPQEALKLGQIPENFWELPRELWLRRQGTKDEIRVIYWKDGALVPEGYWQVCAILRDVRANRMTSMDPVVLDILRGIQGYYQAWRYPQPIIATSGFRTLKTNTAIAGEGAAKNSMHLYGKGVDLYIPGIPPRDIGLLGVHLRQGGVGFYPNKGFTHLDTGRLRTWRG